MNVYRIGHPSYSGLNRYAMHTKYSDALRELLSRGIRMNDAHNAIKAALAGSHACASRYARMSSGRLCSVGAVEVIYQQL